MCLPRVLYCDPDYMFRNMGGYHCRAYYDYGDNTIYLNTMYRMRFWTLFHEMIHWALCLIPHCDLIYYLNLLLDELDEWVQLRR